MSDDENTTEEWDYEDTHDGCCGRACTPNGCPESHPTGVYVIGGPEWADPELIECYGPAVTNEAHARLITAAPELLESAQFALEMLGHMNGPTEKLRAAIAKAQGTPA